MGLGNCLLWSFNIGLILSQKCFGDFERYIKIKGNLQFCKTTIPLILAVGENWTSHFNFFYFLPLQSNFHSERHACQHLDQGALLRHCGKVTETSVLISPQCISNEVVWGYTVSINHFYSNRSRNTDNNKEKQCSTVSSEKQVHFLTVIPIP